ncbi:MAG: YebC/PmpR family DNA-binding transcriptional regulator [Proteobacteria bacterium]|nr:YebC/PmpR family DNA-binding transcriptional regulator [Pseudomonadota bacterium]NBY20438.1 YebC/PmpR family DNA-binding transcriptional regulator [bacterium]
MGAQWKQKGRVENAAKRGQIISKMCKEIILAAKAGDPDPANNSKLRTVIEAAKKASVPRDNIERAIKKGAGLLDPVNYELVTFEGFTPHKIPLIVECLTDNRNRTSADMKAIFRKGSLGASGSVSYMFDHVGLVVASHSDPAQDAEEAAIEAGAQDVRKAENEFEFICSKPDLIAVTKSLQERGWQVSSSEFVYLVKDPVDLSDGAKPEVEAFLNELDDNDDVHRIFTALK